MSGTPGSTHGGDSGRPTPGLEREIKLAFAAPEDARAAVAGLGAVPLRPRRLQHDALLDTEEGLLRSRRSILRVRIDPTGGAVTVKGPVQASAMKLREEIEAAVPDSRQMLTLLERAGLRVWFRYEKYREEFALEGLTIAIDETPIGTFVELEGVEERITETARRLGRGPDDYVIDSYRALFLRACDARGVPPTDMLFGSDR